MGGGEAEFVELGMEEHLGADEDEQDGQSFFEVVEVLHHAGDQEEERTQSEDGEDIGIEDNERIFGHGEDGRNGVDGEDDIGEFNDDEYDEQRGDDPFAVFLHHEVIFAVVGQDPEMVGHEFHDRMIGRVDLLGLVALAKHLYPRKQEESPEDVENPAKARNEAGADEDEDKTHDDGAEDPPE